MSDVVIGMGEIGKPLADILSMTTDVIRRDVEPVEWNGGVQMMHICFPYSDTFVEDVFAYHDEYKPGAIVIHSTVVPGTTRSIIYHLMNTPIAYSPVRGRHTEMHRDLMRYGKFVSAITELWAKLIADWMRSRMFHPRIMMPLEALELAKLVETTYSGVLIAWAQEIERLCNVVEANRRDVLQFTDEIEYLPSHAFYPGHIGGHCIMQNLELLEQVDLSLFADAIRESNALAVKDDVRRRPERLR